MSWHLGDFFGFAATVIAGVAAIGCVVCMLPDLFGTDEEDRPC